MRTKPDQTEHNQKVRQLANYYKNKEYRVAAAIFDWWDQPGMINRHVPDIIVSKGKKLIVIEVETPKSVNTARDKAQRKAFRTWANRSPNRQFRSVVTR